MGNQDVNRDEYLLGSWRFVVKVFDVIQFLLFDLVLVGPNEVTALVETVS